MFSKIRRMILVILSITYLSMASHKTQKLTERFGTFCFLLCVNILTYLHKNLGIKLFTMIVIYLLFSDNMSSNPHRWVYGKCYTDSIYFSNCKFHLYISLYTLKYYSLLLPKKSYFEQVNKNFIIIFFINL